jgi:hypothetical protein
MLNLSLLFSHPPFNPISNKIQISWQCLGITSHLKLMLQAAKSTKTSLFSISIPLEVPTKLNCNLKTMLFLLRRSLKSTSATPCFRINLLRRRDLWCSSVIPKPQTNSYSVLPDSPLMITASAQRMFSEMEMVMFPAFALLHKNHLTTQRALSARKILIGLFLSILCAMHLKQELLAMTNSPSLRTMKNALLNSLHSTMLAVA